MTAVAVTGRVTPSRKNAGTFRRLTAPLRLLPDFLIIGAQKCGTTTVYENLVRHPLIGQSYRKEVHYFDIHYDRGLNWYRSNFPLKLQRFRARVLHHQPFITGEGSPYYLFHPDIPRRAAEAVPDAKLLCVLRNPVDRAYSHYQMEVERGDEDLSFEEALAAEESRLHGAEEAVMGGEFHFDHNHHSYKARGVYVDQLERWAKRYPRDRMLVLTTGELQDAPQLTYDRIFAFLGLPPHELTDLKRSNVGTYTPMTAETRSALIEYFRPHNARLEEWLGRPLGWDK